MRFYNLLRNHGPRWLLMAIKRIYFFAMESHAGVKEGRFTAQQADGGFTPEMNKEFNKWMLDNADNMGKFFDDPKAAPSPEFIRTYVKERESMTAPK